MVDPIPDADRVRTLRWAKVATVVLVGLSTGLMAVHGDASIEVTLGAAASGVIVGTGLVWYLFPDAEAIAPASSYRYRDR